MKSLDRRSYRRDKSLAGTEEWMIKMKDAMRLSISEEVMLLSGRNKCLIAIKKKPFPKLVLKWNNNSESRMLIIRKARSQQICNQVWKNVQ